MAYPDDTQQGPLSQAAEQATPSAGYQVKVTGKGPVNPAGNVTLGPEQNAELLAQMQEMVKRRENPMNIFLEGLKDASAWGAGRDQGPTEALATRGAQRQKEEDSLYNMKAQMAAMKAAQAQNENTGKSLDALTTGGGGGGGGGGQGYGTISPLVMGEVKRLRSLGRNAEAEKYYQNAVQESNKQYSSAEWAKPIETVVDGELGQVPLSQYGRQKPSAGNEILTSDPVLQKFAMVESGGKNIPNAGGTSSAHGVYQITNPTFNTAKAQNPALKDVTWEQFKANPEIQAKVAETVKQSNSKMLKEAGLPDTPLNQYTAWFSGNTKLAAAPAETPIASIMSREQIAANPTLTGKTAGQVRAMMDAALNKAVPSAAAQTAPQNVSLSQARANEAYMKEQAKVGAEASKKEIEGFKSATEPSSVNNQIYLSQRLGELTEKYKNNPNIVGLLNNQGVGNAIATLLVKGITTPVGSLGFGALEDAFQKANPRATKPEIEARQEIQQILKNYALEASKVGQGQGAMSDFERQMFEQIAGSTSNSMEMLRRVQQVMSARANFNDRIGRAYEDSYQAGKPQDFQMFKKSAEYRGLVQEHRDTLLGITKGLQANPSGSQGQSAPTSGTTSGKLNWSIVK